MEDDHGRSVSFHVQAATHTGVSLLEYAEKTGSSSVDSGMAPFAVTRAHGGHAGGWLERWSLAGVDGGLWLEQVSFEPMIVIMPLVRDKSGRILKYAFRDKLSKL